jgi:hypothetical protein
MANDRPQKISIGFIGGQVLAARVAAEELSRLRSALSAGGWHDLTAEDGVIAIDLSKIVYLLTDAEAHRVGFGS